jgi:DNA-binding NarL/FixJ family response regulator
MQRQQPTCAILADRHTALIEGIRGLLETDFDTVYVVADIQSLSSGAQRLLPDLIIVDLSLVGGDLPGLLQRVADLSPASRVVVLTVHDEPAVPQLALAAGAHGVVLKRCVGTDFMPAIDAVLQGQRYISPDFGISASAA